MMDSAAGPAPTTIDLKHLLETVQAPNNDGNSGKKEKLIASDIPDFSLAYLGPQLWNDTVMSDDLKLELINLDDLLDDGSLSKDLIDISSVLSDQTAKTPQTEPTFSSQNNLEVAAHSSSDGKSMPIFSGSADFALPSYNPVQNFVSPVPAPVQKVTAAEVENPTNENVEAQMGNFSYKPNLTDVMISTPMDDTEGPSELFDPTKRVFTEEELKPQPIIRKAKKVYVPDDNKDAKYWQKREKNNAAAKRSRAARRIKENQIAMRTTFLEKENDSLKQEVNDLRAELQRMIEVVNGYKARDVALDP